MGYQANCRKTEFTAEFKAIFHAITDAVLFTDTKRQIVLVNPAFTKRFGYQPDEVIGKTTQVIYAEPEDYFHQGRTRYNEDVSHEQTVYENKYRHKNGSTFTGETLGTCVTSDSGELLGFLGVIRDVSERVEAQKQLQDKIDEYEATQKLLRESEERFKALHDASFDGVIIHDKGLILDCNQGLSDITGYSRDDLVGMNGLKLIAQDSLEVVLKNINQGYAKRYEVEGVRKDGSVYPLSIKGKNVTYKGSEARVIEFRDITSQKQAEQALRESEERFRQIFETNPDPVILARLEDGAIVNVNNSFVAKTGISRFEALGHNSLELGLWADKEMREPFRAQLQCHGELNNYEADFKTVGNQIRTGLLSARILKTNEEPCVLIVIRDITTEKTAERALIEMDRIKSEFISAAAHELRTPLSAIMGFTELLLDPVNSGHLSEETKRDFLNEILNRGDALNRIIDDFLDISRIESGHPIPLALQETDFADLLGKSIKFYQLHSQTHIYQLNLPENLKQPTLLIDRQRINQVLENLLSNATKYAPKGSTIVLSGGVDSDGWKIQIEDQGIGMTQEQVRLIFNKFYRANTSRTAASGLGLGMSIAKHIVEAHDGKICVESAEGEGTTVTVTLPYCEV